MKIYYTVRMLDSDTIPNKSFGGTPLEAFKAASVHAVIIAQAGFGRAAIVNEMSGAIAVIVSAPEGN